MSRATQADVDQLLAVVRANFPDRDVLGPIAEEGAIDDVPKEWLVALAETFRRVPESQRLLFGAFRAASAAHAKRGAAEPLEGSRGDLAGELRSEVEAYCPDRAATGTLLDPAVLGHLTSTQLGDLVGQVKKLRHMLREQLLDLLELDDRAEARAAERAEQDAARAQARSDRAGASQAMSDLIAEQKRRAEERRVAMRAESEARRAGRAQREAEREKGRAERERRAAEREERQKALAAQHDEAQLAAIRDAAAGERGE